MQNGEVENVDSMDKVDNSNCCKFKGLDNYLNVLSVLVHFVNFFQKIWDILPI